MAEILMKFDTVTKALFLTVDGQEVTDVSEVYAGLDYGYDDDGDEDNYRCSFSTVVKDKTNDTRTVTRVMAADTSEGRACAGLVSPKFPGFVEVNPLVKAQADIHKFFAKE